MNSIANSNKAIVPPRFSWWQRLRGCKTRTTVCKGADGRRYMFLVTSNSYQDQEQEYITTKALRDYVEAAWKAVDICLTGNMLDFWHGPDIGTIVWVDMEGPFLIELARESKGYFRHRGRKYPIRMIWDYMEQNPDEIEWGASHEFDYESTDREDKTYEWIRKRKTSALPLRNAANAYTFSGVIDMSERDNFLDRILGRKGAAAALRNIPQAIDKGLTKAGVQHKSLKQKMDEAIAEVAQDVAMELADAIIAVLPEIQGMEAEAMRSKMRDVIKAVMDEQYPPAEVPLESEDDEDAIKALKSLANLNQELMDTQASIVSEQMEIKGALKGLSPMVEAVIHLPDVLEKLNERLGKVEKQLAGRPRRASEDDGTEISKDLLPDVVRKGLIQHDSFWSKG